MRYTVTLLHDLSRKKIISYSGRWETSRRKTRTRKKVKWYKHQDKFVGCCLLDKFRDSLLIVFVEVEGMLHWFVVFGF
jgi:hypothetical protein